MRLRPTLLTISFMLACSASALIAMESAQTPTDATPRASEDAERSSSTDVAAEVVHGGFFVESEGDESAGMDNRVIFSPQSGGASQSMQQMRARLADPEQRVEVRAEQRAGIEDLYPDVAEVLSLDGATHKKLIDVLTNQQMERFDLMYGARPREAFHSMQADVDAENRKLDALRELLGDEGLERYQHYASTPGERRQVREVDALLEASDRLGPDQRERLIELFKEKNRKELPPIGGPPRMSSLLRSADPGSPTFREDLQRQSQLGTIAANEEVLRRRETSHRWLVGQAAEFLTPTQASALSKMSEAQTQRLRQWIEKERVRAGLDPAIPERGEERQPLRIPVSGDVALELTLKVDGGGPVTVTHIGANKEPLKFQAADELLVEADWTLFDDDWLDVQLTFYEQGGNGRRRLEGGSGISVQAGSANHSSSGMMVIGRKAYSIEMTAKASRK